MEEKINNAEKSEILQNIIDNIPHFVFWKDKNLVFQGCNNQFALQFGYDNPQKIIGKTDYDFPWASTKLREKYINDDQEIINKGVPKLDYEEQQKQSDGTVKTVLVSKVPLYSIAHEIIGVLGIYTDISLRKQLEEDLKEAKERAESASKAKSDFLAVMSHELRTPLNAILGMAQILATQKNVTEEEKQQYLQIICQSVYSQLKLINDILQFTKADAGEVIFDNKPFLLSHVLNRLPNEYITLLEQHQLQLFIHNNCPVNLKIFGDEERLHQVISNLVNNAIKFTDQGHITITAEEETATKKGYANIKITVADTGCGIPKEALQSIFEKFTQIETDKDIYARKNNGVGLGLAICKTFLERMGGYIEVESVVGLGSKFICHASLPLANEQKTEAELANTSPNAILLDKIQVQEKAQLTKKGKILVVEDNKQNQLVVKLFLAQLNYEIELAETGKEALEKLRESKNYDAALMDLSLPDMSGLEIIKKYRATEKSENSYLPIIAVTAHTLPEDREACLAAGADSYLEKPLSIPALDSTLKILMPSS